jgi:hypothetical protein
MDKPKKLILDYSKWRCGCDGPNAEGEGDTKLLNKEGFMCCIGQWSIQLGAYEDELLNRDEPRDIDTFIPLFSNKDFDFPRYGLRTTELAEDCIEINDRKMTTPEQKITELRDRLAAEGIELEVINKP